MENLNTFKVGDTVSFKEDQVNEDEFTFNFTHDVFTVREVSGHCLYLDYVYPDEEFSCFLPPLPRNTEDPFHYKAFELAAK